jgi:hypothetical protein
MTPRRLLVLGGAVTALVVVIGIASRDRPLSATHGSGPTATFFDYLATTLVLFVIAMLVVFVYALVTERPQGTGAPRGPWHLVSYLLSMAAGVAVAFLIVHSGFEQRLRDGLQRMNKNGAEAQRPPLPGEQRDVRNAHIRWDEIAVVVALLGGTCVVLLATRQARRMPAPWKLGREERIAQVFDESLDDLRADPDLRRAIIAAYARMERALAGVGLPRRPSEAPFEYVERALVSLDASSAAAERLTSLFEWAKFSQHEPGPEMRDEAIAALEAVRDELRAPSREPVQA